MYVPMYCMCYVTSMYCSTIHPILCTLFPLERDPDRILPVLVDKAVAYYTEYRKFGTLIFRW